MTKGDFAELCNRYTIDPDIALENDNVVGLLIAMRGTTDINAYSGYRNLLVLTLEKEF